MFFSFWGLLSSVFVLLICVECLILYWFIYLFFVRGVCRNTPRLFLSHFSSSLTIELVNEERIGNDNGGLAEIDDEEEEVVDEGIGNELDDFLDSEVEEWLRMNMEDYDEYLVRSGNSGASKSAIDGLEKEKFGCGFDGDETTATNCVVCLDDISVGNEFTRLLCSHGFHYQCIIQWLEESNNCPICRYEIPD
ncbi:E3 ubiquitin-protein ligase RDUF1-like [Cornus florida]|uniref:E3 ubiquitin-protein ligase RDUF1-like n=1 Tax=Cornus florida TaxID=4283 RepID=UPI0028A1AC6E|nr:E3 ubiquitin-protein ligase RDUF1-like [Cornus florida]